MAHPGLATASRPPVRPVLNVPAAPTVLSPVQAPAATYTGQWLTSTGRVGVTAPLEATGCLVDARLTGRAMITLRGCDVGAMLDGVGFLIDGCRIGSLTRPDGSSARPTMDGLRPCPLPGSQLPALPSWVLDCDVVNTDGRAGTNHMDGMQVWMGGHLRVERVRIDGWWQSAIMLKSDWGPIDDVVITGCYLAGANYFQLRVISGGFGRPTNVTITDNVLARGKLGGLNPMNSGNDRCTVPSQTRYVRTQAERLDSTWIVFAGNVYPDGTEVVPPGGWYTPFADPAPLP